MPQTQLQSLKDFDLKNKNVLMRVDFSVPLKEGQILDPYRIDQVMPSLQYILEQKGKLVVISHLGRPKGKMVPELSLRSVAEFITEKYGLEVLFVEDLESDTLNTLTPQLKKNQFILLENLRFHLGEEANDKMFAKHLASHADIYINEGFSISHRNHASIVSVPELVAQRGLGFQFQKEMKELDNIRLNKVKKPFFVFLGGSKVEDKIPLLEHMMDYTDEFFIGGMIAYTFLKAQDIPVGDCYVQRDYFFQIREFIERAQERNKKIWLPIDHMVIQGENVTQTQGPSIPPSYKAMDIGEKTQKLFCQELKRASSLFWNGPMGFFEKKEFSQGTQKLAQAIAEHQSAYRVIGGGHSASAVSEYRDSIDHISTGGGASLSYLKGATLPGVQSLLTRVL